MLQVVIPAFNEEARLPRTLRALRSHLLAARGVPGGPGSVVEVIVVDNASTDATAVVARREDTPALRVRVIRCDTPGKGAAVRAGVAATTAQAVAYMDADGATAFEALADGMRLLEAGVDVAVGSRALAQSVTEARHSRLRGWGARLYRGCASTVVEGIIDTQCGLKVMRGDVARALFADLTTDGFSFDVELLGRALRQDRRVAEFPVTWVDVPGSTFDPVRHGVSSFVEVAQIAWRLRAVTPPPTPFPVPAQRRRAALLPEVAGIETVGP